MNLAGQDITQMMKRVTRRVQTETAGKQTPWVSTNLTRDFAFRPGSGLAAGTPPSTPAAEPAPKGLQLPHASIRIDGSFDDWLGVPPIIVGPGEGKDNTHIRQIVLAADTQSLFIRIDLAEDTTGPAFRLDTSYAISIDNGNGPDNFSVRLFHSDHLPFFGWGVMTGAREKESFRKFDMGLHYAMKAFSLEIAVPLADMKRHLGDPMARGQYRVVGWTGKNGVTDSDMNVAANVIQGVHLTEAGYFSF